MNDRALFRWMLVGSLALPIIGMIVNEVHLRTLPADVRAMVESLTEWPDSLPVLAGFALIALVYLVLFVGMFQFRPWATKPFLGITALGFATAPFLPSEFMSGAAYTFDSLGTLCLGVVITYILLGRAPVRQQSTAGAPA